MRFPLRFVQEKIIIISMTKTRVKRNWRDFLKSREVSELERIEKAIERRLAALKADARLAELRKNRILIQGRASARMRREREK